MRVGMPIPYSELAQFPERDDMIRELRKRTYALAQPSDIKGNGENLHLRIGRIKGWKPTAET